MGVGEHRAVRNTVDIVIMAAEDKKEDNIRKVPSKQLQVMLIKRNQEPFKDTWTLPGGFVNFDESLRETVRKKLIQKTGISDIYTEQLYTYGDDVHRDPRDRVITIGYIALVDKNSIIHIDKQYDCDFETAWFWINIERNEYGQVTDAKFNRVGFDNSENVTLGFDHKDIVIDAINRMANKIMYTDIGFNLVGKEFTIRELQMAYECVVGKHIAGFRRIIENKLVETDKTTTDIQDKPASYRPAKLYKKKN